MFAWLRQLWRSIIAWCTGKRRRHTAFTGVAFVDPTIDPSPHLRQRKLVLIGSAEKPKWLRFSCPCKCGQVIALNLMESHIPHWKVRLHEDDTLTVHPSVDATTCGSHFWIRHNRIDWV